MLQNFVDFGAKRFVGRVKTLYFFLAIKLVLVFWIREESLFREQLKISQ